MHTIIYCFHRQCQFLFFFGPDSVKLINDTSLVFSFQVVLCDLRKTPIEHRILKKNEVIRPGESVYFDGHFVDVGDPERSHQSPINIDEQGTDQKVIKRRQIKEELNGCLKANSSVVKG